MNEGMYKMADNDRNYYFKKALLSMGIADTRVDSLADASDKLHSALSLLDERNYNIFMSTFSKTISIANAYAECEGMRKFKSSISEGKEGI